MRTSIAVVSVALAVCAIPVAVAHPNESSGAFIEPLDCGSAGTFTVSWQPQRQVPLHFLDGTNRILVPLEVTANGTLLYELPALDFNAAPELTCTLLHGGITFVVRGVLASG